MISESLYRLSKRKSRQHLYAWLAEAVDAHAVRDMAKVLNVGAGGDVAAQLMALGVQARSLDVDPRRHPDILASIEAMNEVGNATTDAVFCLEVLEHVQRPDAAIAEIRRVLRPGGLLIGSSPFLLGIHDAPGDYYRFTRHGLQLLLAGFEELKLKERNGYFSAAAVLIYRRFVLDAPLKVRTLLAAPLLLLLALGLELIDRLLPSTSGTTGYFFIYRKPHDRT